MSVPNFEFEDKPDLGIVKDILIDLVGDHEPVEGYAIIEGARYAIEAYKKATVDGTPKTLEDITKATRNMIVGEGLHHDPWKRTYEFFLGIALGAFLARRADSRSEVVKENLSTPEPILFLPRAYTEHEYYHRDRGDDA